MQRNSPATNTTLRMTVAISLLLHILLSPFVGRLLTSAEQSDEPSRVLITEILNELARGEDHKNRTIDRNQVIGMAPLKVETIAMEIPLHTNRPHKMALPSSTLTDNLNSPRHSISRRRSTPLTRRPEHLQRKYTRTVGRTISANIPQITPQNAPPVGARVVVKVVINPVNGALKSVSITQSSKSWALDQAALMAIKKSAPFPPLDIDWDEIVFRIPIRYHK